MARAGGEAVFVHVGQCGAQLGAAFWRAVAHELREGGGAWAHLADGGGDGGGGGGVRRRGTLRAVFVDSEPTAVDAAVAALRPCAVSAVHAGGGGGCGNNWAHGYAAGGGGEGEGNVAERVAEEVRAHAERCAVEPAFVVCYSLGGGTGSGLGSRVLEVLRRERPEATIIAVAIAPDMESGPAAQSLNVAMAAQWLHEYADAVMLWRNGELAAAARRAAKRAPGAGAGAGGAPQVTMASMNDHVAAPLLALLAPAPGARVALGGAALATLPALNAVVTEVCPHPAGKLATAAAAPRALVATHAGTARGKAGRDRPGSAKSSRSGAGAATWMAHARAAGAGVKARAGVAAAGDSPSWAELGRALDSQLPRADEFDGNRPATCASALLLLRGCGPATDARFGGADAAAAKAIFASARGLGGGEASAVCVPAAAPAALGGGRCAAAAASRADSVGLLEEVARRGRALLDARAFVHWYERHGCPADAIADALEALEAASADARWWHGVGA